MMIILFHKPFEVMSTFTDPQGRKTLRDFVPVKNVYAAGRLDYDSEGLMVLTDDGELNHRLTDPKFEHPKTYMAQVEGPVMEAQLGQLRSGVRLREAQTRPAEAQVVAEPGLPRRPVRDYHPTIWLRIVLREGRKRQVRRMTAAVGLPCLRLVRIGMGPLVLGNLPPGEWRWATQDERIQLLDSLGLMDA